MRPRGSFGPVALALCAAAESGPATARDLAIRAQVGYDAARYTASRLVDVGELVVLRPGRPALLGRPEPGSGMHAALHALGQALHPTPPRVACRLLASAG